VAHKPTCAWCLPVVATLDLFWAQVLVLWMDVSEGCWHSDLETHQIIIA
jgi:hypothetical protein